MQCASSTTVVVSYCLSCRRLPLFYCTVYYTFYVQHYSTGGGGDISHISIKVCIYDITCTMYNVYVYACIHMMFMHARKLSLY